MAEQNTPTQRCCKCKESKPVTEFYVDRARHTGYSSYCKECRRAVNSTPQYRKQKAAYRDNLLRTDFQGFRRRARANHFRATYGLSLEDYEKLQTQQNGKCAICGNPPCGKKSKGPAGDTLEPNLHVDHDHNTGEVRLLLCDKCNRGLGFFRDDPVILEKAAAYLRSFSAFDIRLIAG